MALLATPAISNRARAFSSNVSDRLSFRRLVLVLVLARVALLVLSGKIAPDVLPGSPDHDGPSASRAVLPQPPSEATLRTASDTLVVAGVIALLGAAGAASLVAPDRAPRSVPLLEVATAVAAPVVAVAAPVAAEARSVLPEIARVVRQAAQEAAARTAPPVVAARYAAARSRALGPTTALWHAVALDRLAGARGEVCETTVCGSLVRVSIGPTWPVVARDVCPVCATVAR